MFSAPIPSIRASEVAGDAFLLDVREPDEWAAGHVEGALHMPIGEVLARLSEIPTDQRVVCLCRVGARSAQVTAYLVQQGYDMVNLDGGLAAWVAVGRPIVSETGQPATVL